STLCGYLRIQNLTQDYPVMTTYFDAEIIGHRFGFLTSNDWGATEQDDLKHWGKFPAFRMLKNELKRPGLTISEQERPVTFMRWKERFLVPDHKTKEINGASFAGFYYVAIKESSGGDPATMTGFYFHPYSEPYQQLSLTHIPERTSSSFEFC
ncbi:vacuolar import/degradation protein Vid24, partial [Cantharellus anzutake]|uniref:vacuolar import/degradation protein Vid24 n=1 Tax=Cantharellus anzutake TaxID=1750568 RepID=UPI001905E81B